MFLPHLGGGGAERAVVNLLRALRGEPLALDLVLAQASGPLLEAVPAGVNLIDLGARRGHRALGPLAGYLRREKPDCLIAHLGRANVVAAAAHALARSRARLVLVEHSLPSRDAAGWALNALKAWAYPRATALVAVSAGAARDLEARFGLPAGRVQAIYNPAIDAEMLALDPPAPHPWLAPGEPPVVLSVGRLAPEKDQALLLAAFARLRAARPARLMLLGEGPERPRLEAQVRALGLEADVAMPGYVPAPWGYMRHAAAFALTSRYEGMGLVLVEALAFGCPVVATDCPHGPAEVLAGGTFGQLVPPEPAALAAAIAAAIDAPVARREAGRRRAQDFAAAHAAAAYLALAVGG